MAADAVVVGAGIIGLTTAIRLVERGLDVTVLTADDPLETTSALATAMIGPTFGLAGQRATTWETATVDAFRTSEADAPGVAWARGRFIAKPAGFLPPTASQLPGFAPCADDEKPPGYETAFWGEVPLVDMPRYLAHLVDRAHGIGISIVRTRVSSLTEAADMAPLIAHCAGLAARDLADDPTVAPLRGPKITVANPGIDTFVNAAPTGGPDGTSYHPHGDVVVLGGSVVESWDTTPDPDEAAAIIARCAAIEPRLRNAEVLEHRVGLRPGRPTPRLERDGVGGARVVHNYGHGGSGVTFSWGCAAEAVDVLTQP